jgi:hypothetical protein
LIVLGRMPTDHVVTMLKASPPKRAVGVLLAMPKDRIDRLLAAMDSRLISRLLIAAGADRVASLVNHLGEARLAAVLADFPLAEAAGLLAALPPQVAGAQLERVNPENLALLLEAMPAAQRSRLTQGLDSSRRQALRRVGYERAVIGSLRRTAATLRWVPGDRETNLLAGVFHRLFGVSLCYVDSGALQSEAIAAAQEVFAAEQVHGLLLVSNAAPSVEASDQILDARYARTPALVVTWDHNDNDGKLGRALVRLAG